MEQLKESTIIGPSISVKGGLTGEADLTVHGQVEGPIDFKKSHVTIGRTGCINADVYGKIITIKGEVQGNLFAEEKIVLRQSAVVRGDMRAPRINLEEGEEIFLQWCESHHCMRLHSWTQVEQDSLAS